MTKLITYPNSICSKSFTQEAKHITTKLDKSVKFALKNTGKEYHIAKKLSDVFPETKGKRARGWPIGSTYDDLDAVHTDIGVFLFEIPKRRNPNYLLAHETGHMLDSSFYNLTGSNFSKTNGYIKEYNKDLGKFDENCKKYHIDRKCLNLDYFIQGSKKDKPTEAGLSETFAELYATIKNNGYEIIDKRFKGVMKSLFPNTTKYVTKLVDMLGDRG